MRMIKKANSNQVERSTYLLVLSATNSEQTSNHSFKIK